MIQMVTAVLAKLFFHEERKEFNEAHRELDEAGERLIGMKWKLLRSLSDSQLVELLGREQQQGKLLAVTELLREESEILAAQGKADESFLQGIKAFSLFAELITGEKSFLKVMSVEKFDLLLHRLEQYDLPPSFERKRFRYYEITGNYGAAENVLFELLESDPSSLKEGVSFYERLVVKSDEDLNAGGLPRNEVTDGLAELTSRSPTL